MVWIFLHVLKVVLSYAISANHEHWPRKSDPQAINIHSAQKILTPIICATSSLYHRRLFPTSHCSSIAAYLRPTHRSAIVAYFRPLIAPALAPISDSSSLSAPGSQKSARPDNHWRAFCVSTDKKALINDA
jgi:hypothetical protein